MKHLKSDYPEPRISKTKYSEKKKHSNLEYETLKTCIYEPASGKGRWLVLITETSISQ